LYLQLIFPSLLRASQFSLPNKVILHVEFAERVCLEATL
jgi:hypothetical protein